MLVNRSSCMPVWVNIIHNCFRNLQNHTWKKNNNKKNNFHSKEKSSGILRCHQQNVTFPGGPYAEDSAAAKLPALPGAPTAHAGSRLGTPEHLRHLPAFLTRPRHKVKHRRIKKTASQTSSPVSCQDPGRNGK